MELFLLLLLAGVIGYFFGRSRRNQTSQPASQQVVDVKAKDTSKIDVPEA